MWGKVKLRRADVLYSQYLRKKRKYLCEYCGRFFSGGKGLTVSHFYSRRKESVRFDDINCSILCIKDHAWFESHKTEYEQWLIGGIGQREFDLLALRANSYKKKDDKLQLIVIKQLIKEQE